jgi:DNA-binding NtrC family response regulator
VLVSYFLKNFSEEFGKGHVGIADETLDYLLLFSWPGNVRQLANEMRRAVALADIDDILQPAHLSPVVVTARRTSETPVIRSSSSQLLVKLDQSLPSARDQLERAMLEHALRATHGRVESAAKLLGLSRKGLYLKRHRLGLEPRHQS